MSTKATTIVQSASRSAKASEKQSRLNRAESYAKRAVDAARDAIRAANEALAAVSAVDPERAAKAAKAAYDGKNAAESAAVVVRSAAGRRRARREAADATLTKAVRATARYLVTYNGQLLASFLREDDALLFESELADLDLAHGVESATCEVRSWNGERTGGYLIAGGHLLSW